MNMNIGMKSIVFSAVFAGALVAAADKVPGMHYDRYFNHYIDSFVTKIFLKAKTKDAPTTTMEQVRTLIRNFHAFSGGMHQIIYLVGWQYAGHDSKFPSWDKVGDQCKSSLSDDPLTSLRMVMREAREKYEKAKGPLWQTDITEGSYEWLNDPWPWDEGGNR